jgi:hypothetical protein
MTCQSLFGVGEGDAEDLAEDFAAAFEDDFDLAKEIGANKQTIAVSSTTLKR